MMRSIGSSHGLKDQQKDDVNRYAGTSFKYAQRFVVSEAVTRGWKIATCDISKAFLQGVTYRELSELTGEPLREVNFTLPSASNGTLRKVKGFETFNPYREVLHCDKPGTGSVDAPRCFLLNLSKVTNDVCGMRPSSIDQELCMQHVERGGTQVLLALLTKHVDDIKITGGVDTSVS